MTGRCEVPWQGELAADHDRRDTSGVFETGSVD
jgi:hypothetical protein